jgi:hypothetical protein
MLVGIGLLLTASTLRGAFPKPETDSQPVAQARLEAVFMELRKEISQELNDKYLRNEALPDFPSRHSGSLLQADSHPHWLFKIWLASNGTSADWPNFEAAYFAWRAELLGELAKLPGEEQAQMELRAKTILHWLHRNVLRQYDENATDLPCTLQPGRYNCVSATILFHACARDCGLTTQTLLRGNHCRVAVWTGAAWLPLETTCASWGGEIAVHNPGTVTGPHVDQGKATLFGNRTNREIEQERVVSDAGLLGLIFFNRAVDFHQQGEYEQAVAENLNALRSDSTNRAALANLTASVNAWAIQLAHFKQKNKAIRLLNLARKFELETPTTEHNLQYVLHFRAK